MIGGIKYFVGERAQNFVVDFENANSRLIIKPWYKNHQTRKTIRKRYLNQRYSNKITGMRYFHFNVILKSIKNRLAEHQHSNDINQKSRASIYISSLRLKDKRYAVRKWQDCTFYSF